MKFFRKIAGILGFVKDDVHTVNDEDDDACADADADDTRHNQPIPGPRKGFSVPVQVTVERPILGPILVPCNDGDGGIQGLKWYAKRLRIDEDGDVADEFLNEVFPDMPCGAEAQPKALPRFEVKYSAHPAKVMDQALTNDGKFQQCIEWHGRLQWI
ncbi:hypothetical protein Ancab_032985 [Ancistrocladus abbreviatus]